MVFLYLTGDVRAVSDISNHDTDLTEGSTTFITQTLVLMLVLLLQQVQTLIFLVSLLLICLKEPISITHEARVQAKLDNAFAQLSAMLNNLATTTTLTLNLSGDPTPGAVVTTGVSSGGLGGFTAGTAVATTGGTGSGLTVDTTVVNGAITAAAVNAGGSDYLITDTVTITNPNLGGVATFNFGALVGVLNIQLAQVLLLLVAMVLI